MTSPVPLRRATTIAIAFALGALASSANALTLYDDFSSTAVSPYRWQGTQSDDGASVIIDSRRALNAGALRLEARVYGDNGGDVLGSRGFFGVRFARSPVINDIKVTLTPRTLATASCPTNTGYGPTTVGFQVGGAFFNSSTGAAPGHSPVLDVRAYVQILRADSDPAGQATVTGIVLRCVDEICRRSYTPGTVALGTVSLNTPVTVEVQWDPGNHRFVFRRDVLPPQYLAYTYPDTQPAHDASKVIEVVGQPLSCSTGRIATYGGADVDNVYTNTLP